MGKTLSIDNNIKAEDLKLKLKESTSFSEEQIKEIVPVILNTLSEIKEIENSKAENTTKQNLKNLSQSIENSTNISNNQNVSIDMKNNN